MIRFSHILYSANLVPQLNKFFQIIIVSQCSIVLQGIYKYFGGLHTKRKTLPF